MTPGVSLVALLGFGLVTSGIARSIRSRRRSVVTPLSVVGVVLVCVATAGVGEISASGVPRWVLLSAVLATAGLVGVVGLGLGTVRDDAQLATAGYWLGSSFFAVPVVLVGRDALAVVAAIAVTLLLAVPYAAVAERTPARTVTVGSQGKSISSDGESVGSRQ